MSLLTHTRDVYSVFHYVTLQLWLWLRDLGRGRRVHVMVAMTGVMYSMGYSLAGWLGYACYHMLANSPAVSFSWRFPLAVQVLFPLSCWRVVPGSLQQNRHEEALTILERLHETPDDPQQIKVYHEFDLIDEQYILDHALSLKRPETPLRALPHRPPIAVAASSPPCSCGATSSWAST